MESVFLPNTRRVDKVALLRYLARVIDTEGISPPFRRMVEELHISSTSVVAYNLKKLEQRGYIFRILNPKTRAVRAVLITELGRAILDQQEPPPPPAMQKAA